MSEYIERQLPTLNAPGVAIGLTHREQILHVGTYGLSSLEAKSPVTPKTLFQIGSISKSFTSVVLLQLQEQGLLDIQDPVTKYIPWFEIQSKYDPITLQHLMSHTAGIVTGSDATVSAWTEAWNLRYTIATAPPGELFHYSNTGYKILGLVLQTLLGKNIADILKGRILEPLGMQATSPVITTNDRSRLAVGYGPFFDDRPLPSNGLLAPAPWIESDTADGSICSTAEDMCRYIQALLKDGHGLLSANSFEQLIKPIIPTRDDEAGKHYGLGLSTQQIEGHRVIGHSGGMVGFTADMLADLDAEVGVIVLANGPAELENMTRFLLKQTRAFWAGNEIPETSSDVPENIETDIYAGKYASGDKSFALTSKNRRLYLDFESATVPLEPRGPDTFLALHPTFELFPLRMWLENDEIVEATWGGERYVRVCNQDEPPCIYPAEWEAYPGHYRSHNPWLSNFRIVLRRGTLIFIYPFGDEEPLQQLEPGLFRIGADARSPEFIRFDVVIDDKAMQANLSGGVYSRTFTP